MIIPWDASAAVFTPSGEADMFLFQISPSQDFGTLWAFFNKVTPTLTNFLVKFMPCNFLVHVITFWVWEYEMTLFTGHRFFSEAMRFISEAQTTFP
jgi:hypothetical protein